LASHADHNCSTLTNYPFSDSLMVFQRVSSEFQNLCDFLDETFQRIKVEIGFDASTFVPAVNEYGDRSHFLFFMRDGNFNSAKQLFAREGDRKKVNKYLLAWWNKHHKGSTPRKFADCFK